MSGGWNGDTAGIKAESERKNAIDDERYFGGLASGERYFKLSRVTGRSGDRNVILAGRKVGKTQTGGLIGSGGEIGIERGRVDLNGGRKICAGAAESLQIDGDGSERGRGR